MSQGKILKDKIAKAGLAHVMAAHSPLSARLVEEAGFDGLWASGFELSALYGLADVSLISMSQHLDMVRAMAEQSSLPIVADIDTGFGNAINVIYAIADSGRAANITWRCHVRTVRVMWPRSGLPDRRRMFLAHGEPIVR